MAIPAPTKTPGLLLGVGDNKMKGETMSLWKTLLGGTAGLLLGGPLGALLGGIAGHAWGRMTDGPAGAGHSALTDGAKQAAFALGVIVLAAKMAKADGIVTRNEVDAFKRMFHVPPEQMNDVARIFDEAKKEAEGFEPYAKQIAFLFKDNPRILEDVLGGLFHIALADGVLHPSERDFLRSVAQIFGFGERDFNRVKSTFGGRRAAADDAYTVLGATRSMTDDEIKAVYRKLTRENHPDQLMARGLPREAIDLATEKMAAINAAYDRIRKDRGI